MRRGDEAPRALLFDGSPVMPSGVYADEQGRLSVGRDAERLSQLSPERFEPYPKRGVDEGSVLLGSTEVTVVEMLASLLRRAAEESLQAGVNPVGSTVLTCPADWGGQRRGVLLEAARAANLGPVVLVDEPIAAAEYCLRVLGQQVAPLQSLAVFDFGGGTLDVSVVRREFDGLRVLGLGGLDDLGGVDIDAALVGHLGQLISLRHPELWQRLSNPDTTAAKRDRRELWEEVRAAKEMLSRTASAPVHLPGTDEALHLTREELERVAGPLIDRAVDETRRVLERAGVDVRQLAGIFLVGGSSRIPLVASRLHARCGVAPVVPEQPELPVAYGGMLAVGTAVGSQPPTINPPPPMPPRQMQRPPVQPVSPTPSSGFPVSGVPTSGSGAPYPVSAPFAAQPATGPVSPPRPLTPQMGPPPNVPPQMAPPSNMPPPNAPPAYGVGVPVVAPARRRRTGPWIALVIVLAIIGGCVYGGNRVFTWFGDQFESAKNGLPGFDTGTDGPGQVDGLKAGAPIALASDGSYAATAGAGAVYTAQVSSGSTLVTAYATTGNQTWTATLQMEPEKVFLTVVGNLLIVDGENDAKLGGAGDLESRSVIDIGTHQAKWTKPWNDKRLDVQYIGTDAIVEDRDWNKAKLERVNLLDGSVKWTSQGDPKETTTSGQRNVLPALHWPGKADANLHAPSYGLSFAQVKPFQETLAPDAGTAVQLIADGKAQIVDLNTGKPKSSGKIDKKHDSWLAYDGLVMVKPENEATIIAYRQSDWGTAWTYKATTGTTAVDDLRPCGEHVVCVQAEQTGNKKAFIGIDTSNGQTKWTNPTLSDRGNGTIKTYDKPNWYVMGDGKLVAGTGTFMTVDDASLVDPGNGKEIKILGEGLAQQNIYAGYGNNLVIEAVRKGTGQFAAFVVTLDGKIIGSADLSTLLQDVSVSNDTLVAVDEKDNKVYRFEIPAAK
ncbi:Hsp70 family protein [Dactylosporangium sp. CS-047395]|uniref:Hsp70 family protein n=1 Tax=Dactylosporangium sp. CS-047395 TaxID=3239936 RepID=UPI003D8A08AC